VAVRVPADEAEPARARLLGLAPGGFEEIERPEELQLAAYVDDVSAAAIVEAFPDAAVEQVEPGWEDRWREFHHAVRAGGLWVGPPWETPEAGELAVVIDPGRAFGTGAHPTTRASLELVARRPPSSLLDAGCGSGVVAIAAARLGFDPVVAVDADPVAVEVTRENAARNGVTVEARQVDVLTDELPGADLVVANIELRVVEALLARCESPHAITSGYLAGEAPAASGWTQVEAVEVDGWAAHLFASARGL
jgi:ribosomal protein L11 methyltransferase